MNRVLPHSVACVLLLLVGLQAFSQVKLTDVVASKFYENNTRITYFDMADFPNTEAIRDFVERKVVENSDVLRLIIYTDGIHVMYEAQQKVEPDKIVEEINCAVDYYFTHEKEIAAERRIFQARQNFDPMRQKVEEQPLPPATVLTVEPVEKQAEQPAEKASSKKEDIKQKPNLTKKQNIDKADTPIINSATKKQSVITNN